MIDIRPSILAADLMNLEADICRVQTSIEWLHFDVMDGHFVPNLSFGPALCAQLRKTFPQIMLDVHLMLDNPEKYIDVFADNGADAITVHAEAAEDGGIALIRHIHEKGKLAGIAVRPGTDIESLPDYSAVPDLFLIMTVEPGFGGQKFMPAMLGKCRYLRDHGYKGVISVDGGITEDNVQLAVQNGVTAAVMGTAVFKSDDPVDIIRKCKSVQYEKQQSKEKN